MTCWQKKKIIKDDVTIYSNVPIIASIFIPTMFIILAPWGSVHYLIFSDKESFLVESNISNKTHMHWYVTNTIKIYPAGHHLILFWRAFDSIKITMAYLRYKCNMEFSFEQITDAFVSCEFLEFNPSYKENLSSVLKIPSTTVWNENFSLQT